MNIKEIIINKLKIVNFTDILNKANPDFWAPIIFILGGIISFVLSLYLKDIGFITENECFGLIMLGVAFLGLILSVLIFLIALVLDFLLCFIIRVLQISTQYQFLILGFIIVIKDWLF